MYVTSFLGCSWESCQSLLNVFPHVSDCLQCEKDKCNSDPCVDGKVSSWRRENIDKHYIKVKNRSRYKLVWPDPFDDEKGVAQKYEPPKWRYPSGITFLPNDIQTASHRSSTNSAHFPVTRIHNETETRANNTIESEIETGNSDNDSNVPAHSTMNLDAMSLLEKLMLLLLLLTLLLICLLTCCWICLCKCCHSSDNIIFDGDSLHSDCAEGNDSNKFETFDEDCYSEITNRKQNLNNDKIRNNIEKHHYNKDKKGKGIDHIDKEKKNDNKLRDSKNNKNKNSSNKKEAIVVQPCKNKSKVNYEYESTAELKSRPASREFDRHSASVHYKGTNKPVQGSSKGLQELDRSNGPISSSVRCLLIPAYYIRGLSLSALHMVLASQNIMAIKDKESSSQRNSGQMSTLGDAGPSTSNQFDRSSDNVIEESDTMSAGGTGDISVRYKYQYCGDFV